MFCARARQPTGFCFYIIIIVHVENVEEKFPVGEQIQSKKNKIPYTGKYWGV